MNKKTANQLMTIFVLFLFVGSGFAYALMYIFPETEQKNQKLFYEGPLENSEEAPFLQKNYVIVKLYFKTSENNSESYIQMANDAFQDLGGKIVVEFIDVDVYDEYEKVPGGMGPFPAFYLKGSTITKAYPTNVEDLKSYICKIYFEPIDECSNYE